MKKLKKLVFVAALGAAVAAVAKKLQAGQAEAASGWQSADSGSSAPEPTHGPAPLDVDEVPDEALVDNAPAPADMPQEPVMPEAAGPQSTSEDDRPEAATAGALSADESIAPDEAISADEALADSEAGGSAAPDPLSDPLTDPLPENQDEEPRP